MLWYVFQHDMNENISMHGVSAIVYIILAACLLPYAFAAIAKMTAGFSRADNENPREFLAKTSGLSARANAVQQNSFEGLPLFLSAILFAEYLVVPHTYIMTLGIAYLLLRVLYGLCYLANLATLRSVIWSLGLLCPIFLLIITIKISG